MKKPVILLLVVVYLVSIVVVTFFGMQTNLDQFTVYLTNLEITNYSEIINGQKYYWFDYAGSTATDHSFYIECATAPTNATHPERLRYSLSGHTITNAAGVTETCAGITANGELYFTQPKTVLVIVTATDGSKLTDSLVVICV